MGTYRKWFKDKSISFLGIEVMFLYLNVLLQRNQTGKSGWAGFRVPERYDCRTKDHVSFEKIWSKVDGPSKVKVFHMTFHFQIGHSFS